MASSIWSGEISPESRIGPKRSLIFMRERRIWAKIESKRSACNAQYNFSHPYLLLNNLIRMCFNPTFHGIKNFKFRRIKWISAEYFDQSLGRELMKCLVNLVIIPIFLPFKYLASEYIRCTIVNEIWLKNKLNCMQINFFYPNMRTLSIQWNNDVPQ
jgi:hypothetical protein